MPPPRPSRRCRRGCPTRARARRAEGLEGHDEAHCGARYPPTRALLGMVEAVNRWRPLVGSAGYRLPAGPEPLRSRPLNISSMRSVTTTPPTMLRVARITATRARLICNAPWASSAMTMAPTRMIAVDGVAARHERRVQDARHLGDDLEADEGGQHEDHQDVQTATRHDAGRLEQIPGWRVANRRRPAVMHVASTMSSSKSGRTSPSRIRSAIRLVTLRA